MAKSLSLISLKLSDLRVPRATRAVIASFMLAPAFAACGDDTPIDTGLTGLVLRGPITPVCVTDQPCDAPFAATFTVTRNGRSVRRFTSGADGTFSVLLEPGGYRIVPAPDAPIISPTTQVQDVVVGDSGITTDTLFFDTGIR